MGCSYMYKKNAFNRMTHYLSDRCYFILNVPKQESVKKIVLRNLDL